MNKILVGREHPAVFAENPELIIDHKSVEPGVKSPELTNKQKQIHEKLLSILDELKESLRTYGADFEESDIGALKEFLDVQDSQDLEKVLNFQNENGMTILHDVAEFYDGVTELLLNAGADPNIRDKKGKTPLHYAADFNSSQNVIVLLNKKANLNIQDEDWRTPLHCAVNSNACESAVAIMEAGAGLDVPDANGQTPLLIAAICDREDTAKRLLEKGAKYNVRDKKGNTAIYYAVSQGLIGIVECLMEKDDIELNTLHVYWNTPECGMLKEAPLHSAVALNIKSGRIEELLLRKESIDVNIDDGRGNTPLLIAAGSGRNSTVDLLTKKGANVHHVNEKGNSVFHFAAANEYLDKFSMHFSSGKSKNDIASVGWFYDAEQANNTRSVVDLNPCMIINTLVRHIIKEEEKKGSNINQIKQAIVDSINARNQDGNTPLFFAVERGNHDVITKLLGEGAEITVTDEKGAKVVVTDQNGYTPYHYDIKSKSPEILKSVMFSFFELNGIANSIEDVLKNNIPQKFDTMHPLVQWSRSCDIAIDASEASRRIMKKLASIPYKNNNKEFIDKIIENIFPNYIKEDRESCETIKNEISKIIMLHVEEAHKRLSVRDKEGNTLFHHAVKWGCGEEILDFLVSRGVDINAKNEHGVAPIHIAAKYGNASQMECFIRNKADLNVQCGNFTKAETEILEENFVTVQDGNSVVTVKKDASYENETPIFIAADNLNASAVHVFTSEGVNPNIPNKIGATPLHVVIARILNKDYEEQKKEEIYEIFERLILSSTDDLLWYKNFIEVLDGDEKEKEELKKVIDNTIEDSKTPTAQVEESAPEINDDFYKEIGSHVNKAPDLYLTAYNKANGLTAANYGVGAWNPSSDHHGLEHQREVTAEEIKSEWAKELKIEESAWGEKGDIPKASGAAESWGQATNSLPGRQHEEKEPSTILSDSSIQEVNVEERSHLERTELIKRDELKLNKFLNEVLKAQNMVELNKIVDEALKAGVRLNFPKGSEYNFTNCVTEKISKLEGVKGSAKVVSSIICQLTSKGAIFGQNYHKVNDELEKLFKDHRTNLQKANSEFCKRINEFQRVVESSINKGVLNNLQIDNTTFYLECSPDSVVDVSKIIDGRKSLGLTQGNIAFDDNIVKIGESEIKIEVENGIKNYTNISDGSDVVLTFSTSLGKLEVRLYSDTENKDIIRIEVSDQKKFDQLVSIKEEIGKNCLLGGYSVLDAIKQGYFERSGKFQPSETISLPGEASETIKSLKHSDITANSWRDRVQRSRVNGEAVQI